MNRQKLTAANLVSAIDSLNKNVNYNYVNSANTRTIQIVRVTKPEGSVVIKRGDTETSISTQAIWRLAEALSTREPINVDRVFGASYNYRSALEALLAHTPEIYWCQLQRIQPSLNKGEIVEGHKHIIWMPEQPHEKGIMKEYKTDMVISEIPSNNVVYDALSFPLITTELGIEVKRRHVQIQIALSAIGFQLGFRTWIARNDQGISYGERKIADLDGIVHKIENENLISPFDGAVQAALHIDCIWFKNGKLMPAVMEVEHSTGVNSGLTRMMKLKNLLPPYSNTRWVIVAPDEDRDKVFKEANNPIFHDLNTQYFSYSAVEELYSLCLRRKLTNKAVNEDFLDCFMEKCIN